MSGSDSSFGSLPSLHARLQEAQRTVDSLHLAMHNIGFAIAYGAAEEAWPMLNELGHQRDLLEREIEALKAEIARSEAADGGSPLAQD